MIFPSFLFLVIRGKSRKVRPSGTLWVSAQDMDMRKEGRIYDLYSFENEQMRNDLDWSLWDPIDGYGLDDDGNYPEVF